MCTPHSLSIYASQYYKRHNIMCESASLRFHLQHPVSSECFCSLPLIRSMFRKHNFRYLVSPPLLALPQLKFCF
jgi:hypothetical protein